MFEGIWNTSDGSLPTGLQLVVLYPQDTEEQLEDDNDEEEHMDNNADSDGDDDTTSTSKGKKRHVAEKDNKGKKVKTTVGNQKCQFCEVIKM